MAQRYSEEFKKSAVQKVLLRGSRTVHQVCEEIGIANPSFYQWRRIYGTVPGMNTSEKRPQDWTPAEKFKAVLEYEALGEEMRGQFLRSQGLHSEHVDAWRELMKKGLEASANPQASRAERAEDKKRIRELELDLGRKDRALAETTALLVLKKKADLIWGTGDKE